MNAVSGNLGAPEIVILVILALIIYFIFR